MLCRASTITVFHHNYVRHFTAGETCFMDAELLNHRQGWLLLGLLQIEHMSMKCKNKVGSVPFKNGTFPFPFRKKMNDSRSFSIVPFSFHFVPFIPNFRKKYMFCYFKLTLKISLKGMYILVIAKYSWKKYFGKKKTFLLHFWNLLKFFFF